MKLTDEFKSCAGVYIITNLINQKQYIGESLNVKLRIQRHKREKRQIIHDAIEKYGIKNFHIYVEYFPSFNKAYLIQLEEQLIKRLNSIAPHGYNILLKGQDSTGFKHSSKSKEKMSQAKRGRAPSDSCKLASIEANKKTKSEKTKQKISQSNKGRAATLGFSGCSHSQKSKEKMSLSKRGKPVHANSLKALTLSVQSQMVSVSQIDPITLKVINVWPSVSDAAENFATRRHATCIVACIKGKRKLAYGFKWEYFISSSSESEGHPS